ncbi:MAG: phospholipase A [Wenzhouxiangellaceae bacterium]
MRNTPSPVIALACIFSIAALLTAPAAVAQTPADDDLQEAIDACRALEEPARRLACYDALPGSSVTGLEELAEIQAGERPPLTDEAATRPVPPDAPVPITRSPMLRHWELDDATHGGLFRFRRHEPVYLLPARWSSRTNPMPSSPSFPADRRLELDPVEVKFQVSLKTKLADNLFGDNGDLWFGYTQQSNWQAYNGVESEPFRETNYAPELFATWRIGAQLPGGWRWQMLNAGFVHQSNGRTEPLSRSWNRVYALIGLENGGWQLLLRPWLRVDRGSDDNPDIEDYLGHGDLRLIRRVRRHDFALTARYAAGENRGAVQFDWHYPLKGDLKAYLQIFHGYGETLVDYNHRQTTVGIGVSLVQ